MRLRNMSIDNMLFITGISIMFAFIGYFGLMKLTSESVALWTYRVLIYSGLLTGGVYGIVRITQKLTGHGLRLELFRTYISRKRNEAGYGVHAIEHGLCLNYGSGEVNHFTKARPLKIENPVMPENISAVNDLRQPVLPAINNALIVCLYGAQGTGKTSLLCHIIESRRDERAIIIDPHGYQGKYPFGEIIGSGRNYPEIDRTLAGIVSEIDTRYQTYRGQDFTPVTVYADELTLLHKECEGFQDFMNVMMTESRKVGIRFVFCVHSKRAKFLGLSGGYDLADGMLFISLKNENGARYAEIEHDNGVKVLSLPGAYHGVHSSHQTRPERHDFRTDKGESVRGDTRDNGVTSENLTRLKYDPTMKEHTGKPIRFFESRSEKTAVEMSEAGQSLSKIATEIFGAKSGQRVKQVKTWIEKHISC